MLLKDKIALITGSTNNIGLEIARAFAREGATVVVHSRHADEAGKIAAEIGGDSCAADLSRAAEIDKLFKHIEAKHRRLDLLVNTVAHSTKNGILEVSLEEWQQILGINLTAYFLCIQRAARMMQKSGGAIINISAASGERGSPGPAVSSISKGPIKALPRHGAPRRRPPPAVASIRAAKAHAPRPRGAAAREPAPPKHPLHRLHPRNYRHAAR